MAKVNQAMVGGIIRHTLTTAGAVLVTAKAVKTGDIATAATQLDIVGGGLAVLVGYIWSIFAKKKS